METNQKPSPKPKDEKPDWMPKRIVNFAKRASALPPGKYVVTLTVRDDAAFYTFSPMGEVEH